MRFNIIVFILILTSCSEEAVLIGFDTNGWKTDKMGCLTSRNSLITELMNRKEEITGLGQEDIVNALGKPDMHELYKRNKKSFTYFLSNGPDCENPITDPPKLIIRFDGLGRSKDIVHYEN